MVAYNPVIMKKIKKVVVCLFTEVVCDSVQFLEPKNAQQNGGQRQQNEFQDYGQGFGGQQSGQNNSYNNSSNTKQSDNPFANANGPIDISDDDLPF